MHTVSIAIWNRSAQLIFHSCTITPIVASRTIKFSARRFLYYNNKDEDNNIYLCYKSVGCH